MQDRQPNTAARSLSGDFRGIAVSESAGRGKRSAVYSFGVCMAPCSPR